MYLYVCIYVDKKVVTNIFYLNIATEKLCCYLVIVDAVNLFFFSDVLYTCSFMFCEMYYSKICTIPTNMENFNYRLEIIFINKF